MRYWLIRWLFDRWLYVVKKSMKCAWVCSKWNIRSFYLKLFLERSFEEEARAVVARTSALGNRGNDCYRLRAFRLHNSCNSDPKTHVEDRGEHLKKRMPLGDRRASLFLNARWFATSKDNLKSHSRFTPFWPTERAQIRESTVTRNVRNHTRQNRLHLMNTKNCRLWFMHFCFPGR